ncbi:MAG TPA: hypothetical protein PKE03_01850 [Bacteroidales bacterium]|nr:hypothetical protein [Bacteroidales bacterium]
MRYIIFLSLFFNAFIAGASPLDDARKLFFRIEEGKDIARQLQRITEDGLKAENYVLAGYHAVATANLATHTLMPVSRYNFFTEGRNMIEQAIRSAPNDAELRFLRLTIQVGTPAFLHYNQHIATDRDFVLQYLETQFQKSDNANRFWMQVLLYLRDRSRPDEISRNRINKLLEKNYTT